MSANQLARKKAICNAKAQAIVEKLIDGAETETSFLTELRWINQSHYQDVIEERAITKTCGYPLCNQRLVNVPRKQYSIILSLTKVYDISQRKLFCSNQCYKASCYLKKQLLETPLWIRDSEPPPKFILFKNSRELLGDEVSFPVHRVSPMDVDVISENEPNVNSHNADDLENEESFNSNSSKSESMNVDSSQERINPKESIANFDIRECETQNITITSENFNTTKTNISQVRKPSNDEEPRTSVFESIRETHASVVNVDTPRKEDVFSIVAPFNETTLLKREDSTNCDVEMKFQEPNTNCGTIGSIGNTSITETNVKTIDKDFKSIKNSDAKARTSENCSQEKKLGKNSARYCKINESCFTKKANELVLHVEKSVREWFTFDSLSCIMGLEKVQELVLEKGKKFEVHDVVKLDPHIYEKYAALCKKLKILQLQEDKFQQDVMNDDVPSKPLPDFSVLQEQTKEMEIKVRKFYSDKKVRFEENLNENEEDERPNVMPLLHQQNKNAIRRKIVVDKLKIIVPTFATILEIPNFDISNKIQRLAFTFKFSAHNVMFKPLEWNLIVLILIKLLSFQDSYLKEKLNSKSKYINDMLLNYKLENNYLDMVCTRLTDLDSILEKQELEERNEIKIA